MKSAQQLPHLLTPADLVAVGVTLADQKRLRAQRRIAFVRFGHRSVRYMEEDFSAFVNSSRVPARQIGGAP